MKVIIETFSKKDTMYHIECGTLSDLLKDKHLVGELGIPDLESIKFIEDKLKRFNTIDIRKVAGVLSNFKINENKSITADFKPSSLYKEMFKETDIPIFGIRCLTKPRFDGSKSVHDVTKIITWDLIDTKKGITNG